MTPPFDSDAYANVNARHVRVPMIYLVTLEHPELPGGVLYLCRNNEPITSRGNVYVPTRMRVKLAGRSEGRAPTASLVLDDVDKTVLDALRTLSGPLAPPDPLAFDAVRVTVEVVLVSKPDVVQSALRRCSMRAVNYDAVSIEGELTLPNMMMTAYPARLYTEATAPAMFSAVER